MLHGGDRRGEWRDSTPASETRGEDRKSSSHGSSISREDSQIDCGCLRYTHGNVTSDTETCPRVCLLDHFIVGIHVFNREDVTPDMQRVLSECGKFIRTRVGLHGSAPSNSKQGLESESEERRAICLARKAQETNVDEQAQRNDKHREMRTRRLTVAFFFSCLLISLFDYVRSVCSPTLASLSLLTSCLCPCCPSVCFSLLVRLSRGERPHPAGDDRQHR